MIHATEIRNVIETEGKREPFSIKFIKQSTGEIVNAENVVCTSSYFHKNTRNLKFLNSEEIRKIHDILIIEINGQEVFL